jgi:type I restriction enzyme, R subunit
MKPLTENSIEQSALQLLQAHGWQYAHGPDISPGGDGPAERDSFGQPFLPRRLAAAIARLNPAIPATAQQAALQQASRLHSPDLLHNNQSFHQMLVAGINVPYQADGYERSHQVLLVDFANPANNDFLAVNQFTVTESHYQKRPDLVLFVNGLPLVVMELKNAASEQAGIAAAHAQLQTYMATVPGLFAYNAVCIISDGIDCRAGCLHAGIDRYMAWKTADGVGEASRFRPQLETLIKGMLAPAVLLDLVRHFIVFEQMGKEDPATGLVQVHTVKKLAAYHQYHAVNKAVASTVAASATDGNGRGGVVWHTQGSGKSLSMVFYTGKLIQEPALQNPTVVVITDRNDLDDQLFGTFAAATQLLRQPPVQAADRQHLKELLQVASGGIVFTTIQKFLPEGKQASFELLSTRRNIVVIADEAHRTQYGFEAKLVDEKDPQTKEVIGKRIAYGFAKYMRDALPHATYIGFTGTPIEGTDVNTPQVFGQYIDRYDIKDAVDDGATVRIFYESRLAKVNLSAEGRELIARFDKELEETGELTEQQKAKAKWTRLEAIVGHADRVQALAADLVAHFEKRLTAIEGKAMVVAMSRRIAADLYDAIVALRPDWHHPDLDKGKIKVVMTGLSADGPAIARHHTTKAQRRNLAERMKDPADPLQLVIVRDMWLTGFDVPCLHTMYIDKPMQGHSLMQAIARVNRVFKDKPGGLVVDYLGIGSDLKKALSFYGEAGGKGQPAEWAEQAEAYFLEKLDVVQQLFNEEADTQEGLIAAEPASYYQNSYKFNYRRFLHADTQELLSIVLQAAEHVLGLSKGRERFVKEVGQLGQALALCVSNEGVQQWLPEVAFFQAVRARLLKFGEGGSGGNGSASMETAIKQLVEGALYSGQVLDIFDAAGIGRPDISGLSILSDDFLREVQGMEHKNLALELLKRLLNDEIKNLMRHNLVKGRALLEMLERALRQYQNNLLTTAEIIQFLVEEVAKKVRAEQARAAAMDMTADELAFYDALAENDSAVQVLGDATLRQLALEIADKVRANTTIDWTIRESARAKLMVLVKRTLNQYGYPPDKQQQAVETVLQQAERLADNLMDDGE